MHMHNPPHPGEILKDLYIDPLNLTIVEIAKGIGVIAQVFVRASEWEVWCQS